MGSESNISYVEGSAAVLYNEKIYFSTFNPIGCLYCYDIKTETTTFLKQFTVEKNSGMCYLKAILYGNEAWFIPSGAQRLLCVNLDNLKEEYFEIEGHDYANGNSFVACLCYENNKLILIPRGTMLNTMVVVDLQEHAIMQFPQVIPCMRCIGAYLWENKLHFISSVGEEISIFDLKKMESQLLNNKIDMEKWEYSSLVQDKETVYLIPRESDKVCMINLDTKEKHFINLPIPGDSFFGGFITRNGLLMYNWRMFLDKSFWDEDEKDRIWTRCVKIDKRIRRAELILFPRGRTKRVEQYMVEVSSDSEQYIILGNDGYLFLLDEHGNIKKTWDYSIEIAPELFIPKIDRRITMEVIKKRMPDMAMESKMLNLEDFILALIRKN